MVRLCTEAAWDGGPGNACTRLPYHVHRVWVSCWCQAPRLSFVESDGLPRGYALARVEEHPLCVPPSCR